MRYLEKHEVPPIFAKAFPDYAGRKYRVEIAETVSLHDDSWSGGSIVEYRGVDILTGEVFAPRQRYGNMFDNPSGRIPVVPLEEGKAIVAHQIFCGRDMGLKIYVHPNNVNKLLPPPEGGLTDDEYIVIEYTCSLKSSYGGVSNYRFREANRRTGITPQRWEAAKASLQSGGYLDKRGAVTVKGRNARKRP